MYIIDFIVSMIDYCCVRVEHVLTCKQRMCLDSDVQQTHYNTLADRRPIYVRILYTCICLNLQSGIANYSLFMEHDRTCISCSTWCLWGFQNLAHHCMGFVVKLGVRQFRSIYVVYILAHKQRERERGEFTQNNE